ncbi:pullulanase [Streptomyces sp. 3MP-14]|uniref:Pullulanase n=1 Tax=Streptomyces mimosae TaxID=2586635 RepID=A0A5N6AD02_9ACTN|nr:MULTISPECIES: alpha-amylase family glycosyl hydrolase [Streptomyces]KAB8165709.1 pullulanase [Streptomyces mimosae]KAB8176098.1 pullulanase [Streptomyces sp. 3MP-14]
MRDSNPPPTAPRRRKRRPGGRRARWATAAALATAAVTATLLPGTGNGAPAADPSNAAVGAGAAAQPATPLDTTALDTLGAIHTPDATTFRIWSPETADVSVTVGGETHAMSPVELADYTDVYEVVVEGDLNGATYQFHVGGNAVRDPYAQMVNPGTTEGVVINAASVTPSDGSWAPTPELVNREDAVVYELSVRNFTIDPSSGVDEELRGTFAGLTQTGTTNGDGLATGIDHLKELGVTHVQLMPSFDFNSTVPNWGYDPSNFNVPEEQFSRFTEPEERIREFKDMVNEFHENDIRVLMDVVYNHTYSKEAFEDITGQYYTPEDLAGVGNSLDDGNPMVSRMIRDSLEHWVRNYNIDGFRFDLAGVHHYANVAEWTEYLHAAYPGRALQVHGEPWCGGCTDPLESSKVRYGTVPALAGGHLGVFNGAYRDALKGGTRDTVLGYMGGGGDPAAIASGTRGSPLAEHSTEPLPNPWDPNFAHDPEQTINYVSAHDDLNLWDKITYSGVTGGAEGRAGRMNRFAAGMVLTSQGIPFFYEGDEFLHSKVVNGDYETAKNSYNAGDEVNALDWDEKTQNAATFAYYRDAIALRQSTPALRLTSWDAVQNQMVTGVDGSVVVSAISSDPNSPAEPDTVVVYNPTDADYQPSLPPGSWSRALDAGGAADGSDTTCEGLAVTVFTRDAAAGA